MATQKRITLVDVSRAAGLGVATVSRALRPEPHPDVSERTRTTVREVADRLGYQPSYAARALRAGSTGVIALVATSRFLHWWEPAINGALDAASSSGLQTVVYPIDGEETGAALAETLTALPAQGVILLGGADDPVFQAALVARRLPAVGIDAVASSSHISSVSVDNVKMIDLALDHLRRQGRKQVAYLATDDRALDVRTRRDAFERAMGAAAVPPLVFTGLGLDDGTAPFSEELAEQFRPHGFDALICEHDRLGIVAMRTLARMGLRIPEDVAVVGIDDVELAAFVTPSLTSVAQPLHELGRTAVEILLEAMSTGERGALRHVVLEPTLVERDSTSSE